MVRRIKSNKNKSNKNYKTIKTKFRSRKSKGNRRSISRGKRERKIMKGGIIREGFPVTDSLSSFAFSQTIIANFRRRFATPMDCVITALQMIGLVNRFTAEIMRISCMGKLGISTETIENIFIIAFKRNFNFMKISSYEMFLRELTSRLQCNNVAFCGYKNPDNSNHVFLICREACGNLTLIDGTIATNCQLSSPLCSSLLTGKINYYILYNSQTSLTDGQIESLYTTTTFTDVDMGPSIAADTDIDISEKQT